MLKIAIPMANNLLCMHFGHCEEFAFIEVDESEKKILKVEKLTPPPHEPGVIPRWIAENKADLAIVGGMGARALQILAINNVKVITGAPVDTPENLVSAYLNGSLVCSENVCDHDHAGHGHEHEHGHHNCGN